MVDVASLRSRVSGAVFVAGDAGYEEESKGFILNFTHTPDVILGAAAAADVAAAVVFAAENGLAVRVQATGHGSHKDITDGLLITTKRLDALEIDAETHFATIGAGLPWNPIIEAAAQHGLAPITGSGGTVGAVGFLLGGGMGPLVNSYGFGSDRVREFEVVVGNGDIVRANADTNADLFWALRGGKGGLGIVTSAIIELVELPTLYGGTLTFDAENIEAALRAWVSWLETAEPTISTSVAIQRLPDRPFIPEPIRGHTLLSLRFAYTGDAATGEQLAAPLRAAAPVYLDDLGVMPAAAIGKIHSDPPNPGYGWVAGTMLRAIDQDFVSTLLGFAAPGRDFPFISVEVRDFGPAQATDVAGGSSVGGRGAKGALTLVGVPAPELFETVIPTVAEAVFGAVAPWIAAENNVNFALPFETMAEYRAAWPAATFDRLQEIRKTYDPDGLFAYGVHEPVV